MTTLPRILIFGSDRGHAESVVAGLQGQFEVLRAESMEEGLRLLREQEFSGLCLLEKNSGVLADASLLPQVGGILSQIPDGLALLDVRLAILWCNRRFLEMTGANEFVAGLGFYDAFGAPEILGPDLSPFHTALGSGSTAKSTLRIGERSYYQVQATPITPTGEVAPQYLVVSVRDVSSEVLQQQKLNAIYQAGLELGDLSPHDLLQMSVQDRIELLKARIVHYTKDLLEFETVEMRLLDRATKKLEPLLTVGMCTEAIDRELYAKPQGNGVTGFVAATGKSYLCEDTANDPLYLSGAPDARSSLTVPLILHEQILGTFNVESTKPGAFTENDLQFLELFSREVAIALNTLELLVAEKGATASESTERILREVANPVDEVINDAAWVLERYIGHDANLCERLQSILKHTRDIKQLIHKVGDAMTPQGANSPLPQRMQRPKLRNKRVLVADNDETVRRAAHELLGRYGCEVETAHNGQEALVMVRRFQYDLVLLDIRLPDMTGYECFSQIRDDHEDLPVILMTGYGYDPGHSIVKARQRGLKVVLYKPFRVDQLLDEVEKAVCTPGSGAVITNSGETAGTTVAPAQQHLAP